MTSQRERTVAEMTHAQPWLSSPTADPHSRDCYMNTSYSMHNTQSRLPVNDNNVITLGATIGTFEAVVFFHRRGVLLWMRPRSKYHSHWRAGGVTERIRSGLLQRPLERGRELWSRPIRSCYFKSHHCSARGERVVQKFHLYRGIYTSGGGAAFIKRSYMKREAVFASLP